MRCRLLEREPRDERSPVEESELLSCCSQSGACEILAAGRRRQYAKGALIFSEGDAATSVSIIESGSALWLREHADGRRLIVKLVKAGQSVGLAAAVTQEKRLVSVEVLEPVTALEIPARAILGVMLRDASMATRIARIALADYASLLDFSMAITFHPVSRRILSLLLKLEEGGGRLGVTLRHDDLAAMAATTRETFTTQLGALVRLGLVTRRGRSIFIADQTVARSILAGGAKLASSASR